MRAGSVAVAASLGLWACGTAQPVGQTNEVVASAQQGGEVVTVEVTPRSAGPSGSANAVASSTSMALAAATSSASSAVPTAPACPASLHSNCTPDARCAKPGSICTCYSEMPAHCGGAAALPLPPLPPSWHCEPTDRQAARDDGCPYFEPAVGASCAAEGKVCNYEHGCDYNRVVATCKKGAWQRPPGWDQPRNLPPSAASPPGPGR